MAANAASSPPPIAAKETPAEIIEKKALVCEIPFSVVGQLNRNPLTKKI